MTQTLMIASLIILIGVEIATRLIFTEDDES